MYNYSTSDVMEIDEDEVELEIDRLAGSLSRGYALSDSIQFTKEYNSILPDMIEGLTLDNLKYLKMGPTLISIVVDSLKRKYSEQVDRACCGSIVEDSWIGISPPVLLKLIAYRIIFMYGDLDVNVEVCSRVRRKIYNTFYSM